MSECNHAHHDHGTQKLSITLLLVAVYFVAELVGGWWTGSLALLADAGHMFSDMAALGISLFAAWLTTQPSSAQKTFGYHRAEILAALANGALLLLVSGGIIHEAYDRLLSPQQILAGPMLWIASGGLVINLVSLKVLHGGHQHNMNLRGAWLHVMGDTLGSVGVIVAAWLVWQFDWNWADPVASAVVCLLILYSSWNLMTDAIGVLMETAPNNINVADVRSSMLHLAHVQEVHCLHIWTIASGLRALSAHVVVEEGTDANLSLRELQAMLKSAYTLEHVTLQIESTGAYNCTQTDPTDCLIRPHFH